MQLDALRVNGYLGGYFFRLLSENAEEMLTFSAAGHF
jgi:hypothetical protein